MDGRSLQVSVGWWGFTGGVVGLTPLCAGRGDVFSHVLAIGREGKMVPGRFTSKDPCVQNSLKHLGAEAGGSVPRHLPQLQQDCTDECGWENCTKTPLPFTSIPLLDFPLQANACQQPVRWRKASEHEDLWCCDVPAGPQSPAADGRGMAGLPWGLEQFSGQAQMWTIQRLRFRFSWWAKGTDKSCN